jgi:hypothetical protein
MDLGLYFRVIRRFRVLVLGGVVLAIGLAVLTTARVSFAGSTPKLTYRQQEVFSSQASLFVTQKGFPWGSTVPQYLPGDPATGNPSTPAADPIRLSALTTLYAHLAQSDSVRRLLSLSGAPEGTITVNPVPAPPYSSPAILPLLTVDAIASSPAGAVRLANQAADAFRGWLVREQANAGIPAERRVVVQVVHRASSATLASGRTKTLPVVVFLTVLAATFGLIFVLENMRPRARAFAGEMTSVPIHRRTA